jgi:hypothetical protein
MTAPKIRENRAPVAQSENNASRRKKQRKIRPAFSTVGYIDHAFRTNIEIIENGIPVKVTVLEAIVMQLLRAEAGGNKRATRVRLKYQQLTRRKRKTKYIVTGDMYHSKERDDD